MSRARALFSSYLPQGLHKPEILLEITLLKARHADNADIAFGIGRRHPSTQEPAREHAVGGNGNPMTSRDSSVHQISE